DVIGSESLYNEVELMQIYAKVFAKLNLEVKIKYNNRKILLGLMQSIGLEGKETEGIAILDKLDKIGLDKVIEEYKALELNDANLSLLRKLLETNDVSLLPTSDMLELGKKELAFLDKFKPENAFFDLSLARGLDYYTGCIFEVASTEYEIGSIGGGGRYDNLTEMFGKSDLTGVGISFGLERIYDVMEALNRFPENLNASSKLLLVHFSEANQNYAFQALNSLRDAGIHAEMYPDLVKFPKQLKYANDKNIPYVAIVGDKEMEQGLFALKNMETGEQQELGLDRLISFLKSH
ncbi:MAG: ATP phosphoribosyltransferase regulatory subunit, partial [Bacteroidetes bacterium]|nr:ATP phosphoribosyltransferase regulatory subunit [Bacteroidota bacterium]